MKDLLKKDLFRMELQLFNDDLGQPSDVPADTTQNPNTAQPSMDFNYALDVNGNLIINEDYVPPVQEQVQTVSNYTPEEMSGLNWEVDKLDPNRIPPEMQPWYKSMQAGFTRGTQSLAEKQRKLDSTLAEIEAQRQQMFQQPSQVQAQPPVQPQVQQPPNEVDQRLAYYKELENYTTTEVERITGVPYDEYNRQHQVLMADLVSDAKARMFQQTQYQNSLQSTINKHASDPEWANIYNYADEKLSNMPLRLGQEALNRINNGDLTYIDSFLSQAKQEYYEKKNAPIQQQDRVTELLNKAKETGKLVPPVVETGNVYQQQVNPQSQFNPSEFGRMTNQQQVSELKKLGLF